MRIRCLHGYFIFQESRAGEISAFMRSYPGLSIASDGRDFTFETLLDAPRYAVKGGLYLGATVTKTYEGEPWEIMRENGLVYNFKTDAVINISAITETVKVSNAGKYFLASGLIMPGALTDAGDRVTDYSAWYLSDTKTFRYSEVSYG